MTEQESEERWAKFFASPDGQRVLNELADEALAEAKAGLTEDLDPENL